MMVMWSGTPLKVSSYDLKENTEGGWDASQWFNYKPTLKAINPLVNLPYVKDGEKVISQSNACFMYLGRKLNMLGSTPDQNEQCEQLLCELMDLRNKMTGLVYSASCSKDTVTNLLNDVTGKTGILQKLELCLQNEKAQGRSGCFLVGDKVTAPDFHCFEMLEQYIALASYYEQPAPLAAFPALATFLVEFRARPENAKYFASKLYKLPFNNKGATFGAMPSGSSWVRGSEYDYGDMSGIY